MIGSWEPVHHLPQNLVDLWSAERTLTRRQGCTSRHTARDVHTYRYKGTDVIVNPGDDEFVLRGIRELAQDIVDGLKSQFPEESGAVLSAFDIFHLDSIPTQTVEEDDWDEWNTYGNDELDILIHHYSASPTKSINSFVKSVECHVQWSLLRNKMLDARKQNMNTDDFWADFLNDEPAYSFPDIRRLVQLFLVIVLSSVSCERFFSEMNLTKTNSRTRMLTRLLNNFMMIKLNGPVCTGVVSAAFTSLISRAYDMWKSRKQRLPKRSRTEERPLSRKRQKKWQDVLTIERSNDVCGESDSDGEDDSDVENDACVRWVMRRSENGGSMLLDDTSTFTQCRVLIPPDGWSPIVDRRFLDTESTCRDMIKTLRGSSVDKLELIIQFHSGWSTVRYIEIEEGQCPLHYKDNIGWVWVSVKLQGESSRSTFLCNLHPKLYGVDEGYSWCLLEKCESLDTLTVEDKQT